MVLTLEFDVIPTIVQQQFFKVLLRRSHRLHIAVLIKGKVDAVYQHPIDIHLDRLDLFGGGVGAKADQERGGSKVTSIPLNNKDVTDTGKKSSLVKRAPKYFPDLFSTETLGKEKGPTRIVPPSHTPVFLNVSIHT